MFSRQNSATPNSEFSDVSSPSRESSSSFESRLEKAPHSAVLQNAVLQNAVLQSAAFQSAVSETAVSRSRRKVPHAIYATLPAAMLLALGLAARQGVLMPLQPASSTRANNLQMEGRKAILAASQTLVVPAPSNALPPSLSSSSVVWRARLQPVVDVVGRAPISGQITRVWVKPGQKVDVGDRVLRILSYNSNVTVPPPSSAFDRAAEEEQIQAVRAQGELGQRLSSAQSRLKAAQERVSRAQSRVDAAMAVVRKLQNGARSDEQNSDEGDIEYSNAAPQTKEQNSNGAAEVQAAQTASERAAQAAENAQIEALAAEREASRAELEAQSKTRRARDLHNARDAAKAAEKNVAKASVKASVADATANNALAVPAPKSEAPTVSASAVAEADAASREAAGRASSLRKAANTAKSAADGAEARARDAAIRAKNALRSLQLFDDAAPAPRSRPSTSVGSNARKRESLPSLEEAARLVREAISESRKASREAERWKAEVDAYGRQARQTQRRLAASEQNLGSAQQQAQQQDLETTLRRNLSVVRAPANGTVVQIGDVGDNVSFGDPIVLVGKANVLRAQFRDTTGLWRKLKPGTTLTAVVSLPKGEPNRESSTRSSVRSAVTRAVSPTSPQKTGEESQDKTNMPVVARVEEIKEPTQKGEPALVQTVVRTVVSAAMAPKPAKNNASTSSASTSDDAVAPSPASSTPPVENSDSQMQELQADSMRLRAGMTILLPLAPDSASSGAHLSTRSSLEGDTGEIAVPREAVILTDKTNVSEAAIPADGARQPLRRGTVAILQPSVNSEFAIEWREVEVREIVNAQNGQDENATSQTTPVRYLVSGLLPGERVALDASSLRNLTLNYGDDAKVGLRNDENTNMNFHASASATTDASAD